MRPLKIVIIGSSRYPVVEPFAGGLEAHVWHLARSLSAHGHEVTLFAAPGSDPVVASRHLGVGRIEISPQARRDVSMSPQLWLDEHHAYLSLMLELADPCAARFDVVHNHSLHHLPVAMARSLPMPMVTTLHTPPTPWLESALHLEKASAPRVVAVSAYTARQWRDTCTDVRVVPNGVDLARWPVGPGGERLIWFGRLVPEKGAHLAIAAARLTGRSLALAGPISDRAYYERRIAPQLGDTITYLGHLDHEQLAEQVGRSAATVVTPTWEEPYGLVVAESLACGTPVAAFARGGIPEILDDTSGRLARPGDVGDLARAIEDAVPLSRTDCRERASAHCSIERMTTRYEAEYRQLLGAS